MLDAPFPYFGGKSRVAGEVWARFGDCRNYVEPFFGSGAVLFARPPGFRGPETIGDADGFISNFWRSIKHSPGATAEWCDWPVTEQDLEARHYWLVTEGKTRLARVLGDPEGHDPQVAGWWVWGICAWIGGEWCSGDGPWRWTGDAWENQGPDARRGAGVSRRMPRVPVGAGISRFTAGYVGEWFAHLSARLRQVRVVAGDWTRLTGDTVLRSTGSGPTAVFLDPPYAIEGRATVYSHEMDVATAVRDFATGIGARPDVRVALCGYDGEHTMPDGWTRYRWKAQGGYGVRSNGAGRENANRETVWFSPACHDTRQKGLW